MCLFILCVPCTHRDQKRVLDPLEPWFTDGCEPPHGCWELNLGPLQEQQVCLPAIEPGSLARTASVLTCYTTLLAPLSDPLVSYGEP